MAIYKAKTGEWFNSDYTTSGPGVQIQAPPPGGSSSGGNGDGGQQQVTAPPPSAPPASWDALDDQTRNLFTDTYNQPGQDPRAIWEQQDRANYPQNYVTAPKPVVLQPKVTPVTPEQRPATSITTTQVQGVQTPSQRPGESQADPTRRKRALADGKGGLIVADLTDEEYAQAEEDQRQLAESIRKQQEFENGLKERGQVVSEEQAQVSRMLADADVAYKKALADNLGVQAAQRAAEAAMQNNYQMQMLSLQQQLQGQRVALEQRSAQQQRRQTRPFAPRPRVSVA